MIYFVITVIIILFAIWYMRRGEVFMPTALMAYQQNDNVLVASPEHLVPVKKWGSSYWQN